MKYKILVLDIDGTLTNSKKEISPKTKKALMKAQAKGVKLVIASGRPTYGVEPLANELELSKYGGYILSFNGAKISAIEVKSSGTGKHESLSEFEKKYSKHVKDCVILSQKDIGNDNTIKYFPIYLTPFLCK